MYVGIDFGTTNSAVAIVTDDGPPRLLPLPTEHGPELTWRSVLFFENNGVMVAGAPAIARYRDTGGDGRLVQSIKSHLASESFVKTNILGRRWGLEDMIAAYLRQLRTAVGVDLGTRCVIGRPVRYWGADKPEDDARALARMTEAAQTAGFTEVLFEYEPVGAASAYAARLDHQELVLVADFGGGTTDISLMRLGGEQPPEILGTGGVGISGDAFDARIIDAAVAPKLGKGSEYRDEMGGIAKVPAWIYNLLRRWHTLSFLKAPDTKRLLYRVTEGALDPAGIERLRTVIDDDLGLVLHQAVEHAKVGVSKGLRADLSVAHGLDLLAPVERAAFEQWIAPDLQAIAKVIESVLAEAGVAPSEVDRVFATGGTSLVPAVRGLLAQTFGAAKLEGGEELTSVALGLAERAKLLFGRGAC